MRDMNFRWPKQAGNHLLTISESGCKDHPYGPHRHNSERRKKGPLRKETMDSQADSPPSGVRTVNSLQLPSPARWDGCLAVGTAVSVTVTRVAYAALLAAALAVLQSGWIRLPHRSSVIPALRSFPPARASSTMEVDDLGAMFSR